MCHLSMEGCRCYNRFIATSVAVSLAFLMLVSQVDATATLELLMVRFDNPTSRDSGGEYCDHLIGIHTSSCDHIFRFSLDRGHSNNNPRGSDYWTRTTGHFKDRNEIVFSHDMAGVENPIVTTFNAWPSIGVKFKILVTDHDSWSGHDQVDGFVKLLTLTPAPNVSAASWTTVNMHGIRSNHRTSFVFKHKLYCDADYYSSDCSVYCVASDTDADGHYTCDPVTGNKICHPGWEDATTHCRTRSNDCLNNACENGATCVDGARMYTCLCPPGYTGVWCETDINECAGNPCPQGATCEERVNGFVCHCPPGLTDNLCSNINQHTNSTVTPRVGGVISESQTSPNHTWLYILICAACLVLLAVLALIAFLWTKRRKRANISENQSSVVLQRQTSTASDSPAPPPSYSAAAAETAAAAASISVIADGVDMGAWGRRFSQEKLVPFSGNKKKGEQHVYDDLSTA